MKSDVPKNGARRREAASSMPMLTPPPTKTTTRKYQSTPGLLTARVCHCRRWIERASQPALLYGFQPTALARSIAQGSGQ